MLRQLQINNYAIIRDLDVRFESGLTVITGETGAGKSILLGALGLILGKRADSRVLFDMSKKCIVEGRFDISNYGLRDFFEHSDLDYEEEAVIRREVQANGKSRAFINDTPVTLNVLEELASRLIHIHSQHETLDLNRSRFQTGVLDSLGGNEKRLEQYRQSFEHWRKTKAQLQEARERHAQALAERDYIQFQFDELDEAKLDGSDELALESELLRLRNAGDSQQALMEAVGHLQAEQGSALKALRQAASALRPVLRWQESLEEMAGRIESLRIECEDIAASLEQAASNSTSDPEQQAALEERLDQLNRLLHKHRLQRVSQLIELRDQFDQRLQDVDLQGDALQKLEQESLEAEQKLRKQAAELSAQRKKAIPGLEKSVQKLLGEVGMPDARLSVELGLLPEPGTSGQDQVQFLFASNKGSRPEELRQVASGGELSRLMLCIKSLVAARKALPTLIFDEIDSGVSGEIGRKIGVIMEEMARGHQVIAITHLPQIAACGQRHLFVYKDNSRAQTQTLIRELPQSERVEAIARMISGEQISDAARANARELLTL